MATPEITIDLDITAVTASLSALESRQVPYALSLATNDLAKEIQSAIRQTIRTRMTVRRDWVPTYGVKIPRFSDKRDTPIRTSVEIPFTHDFLWKFETGVPKTPRGRDLAIPVAARKGKAALVPASYRPKALQLREVTSGRGTVQVKGAQRSFIIGAGAHPGIYQRTGPGKDALRLLYRFKPSAPTPPVLDAYRTARTLAAARWRPLFHRAFARAMATAR